MANKRPVVAMCKDNKTIYKFYDSVVTAAEDMEVSTRYIGCAIKRTYPVRGMYMRDATLREMMDAVDRGEMQLDDYVKVYNQRMEEEGKRYNRHEPRYGSERT